MRKCFIKGLAILLPITFTVMIVRFCINFLTSPFLESAQALIGQLAFFPPLLHTAFLTTLLSKVLILLCLGSFILLIGMFGKLFLMNLFFRLGDDFLDKLPVINKIYKACHDVVHSLFSSSSKKFSQVVFVPFPHEQTLSMGFVTKDAFKLENCQQEPENLVSVFVPGTPNPSVGFLLMFKREQLLFVNMKVDEAMKFVVSCGLVMPHCEILQPQEAYEKPFFNQDHILSCER